MASAGSDVGGTFTDTVLVDEASGRLVANKVASTPDAPARGALAGLAALLDSAGIPRARLDAYVHGTTVATNAVLTRALPATALVTNAGFEDVIEIGRQNRPHLYDLERQRPAPLVAREARFGIAGRIDASGHEIKALDEAALAALAPRLARFPAIAVVFLHSYANDAHERRAGEILRRALPHAAVSLSCEVVREFREYERTVTTVLNAALTPVLDRYVAELERALTADGFHTRVSILESSGGGLTARAIRRRPVAALLSGPAGGVAACARLAATTGERDLLTLDVGGTSADVSALHAGEPAVAAEGRVAGFPVRAPLLDIETIGAGGGSIARVEGAFLRVGPASAGATPGPAAYGRGGDAPTLTDASLVLGRLAEDSLRRAGLALSPKLAEHALARLGRAFDADARAAAAGVVEVAEEKMRGACQLVAAARGLDPGGLALVAFGGAGPLHAVALARRIGIRRVIVPRYAGVWSALGALACDDRHDLARTNVSLAADAPLDAMFAALGAEAERALVDDDVAVERRALALSVDVRFRGQSHEVPVRVRPGDTSRAVEARFRDAYARRYAPPPDGLDVEFVTYRVAAFGRRHAPEIARIERGSSRPDATALRADRRVDFPDAGVVATRIWDGDRLRADNRLEGPAIVDADGFTCVIPPGASALVDAWGHLRVEVEA
ncbi:MAG: hydantoinase/oxoprolinase family protein [Thermoplasmatota archaeon]